MDEQLDPDLVEIERELAAAYDAGDDGEPFDLFAEVRPLRSYGPGSYAAVAYYDTAERWVLAYENGLAGGALVLNSEAARKYLLDRRIATANKSILLLNKVMGHAAIGTVFQWAPFLYPLFEGTTRNYLEQEGADIREDMKLGPESLDRAHQILSGHYRPEPVRPAWAQWRRR